MIRCQFPTGMAEGERCATCGYVLKRDFPTALLRRCGAPARPRTPRPAREKPQSRKDAQPGERCVHFVGWTDRLALTPCGCSSSKKKGTPTTVAECELHGDVTPLARATNEGLPSCLDCRDFRRLD